MTDGLENGIANGIRTHVVGMKTRCPRPLDDGNRETRKTVYKISLFQDFASKQGENFGLMC